MDVIMIADFYPNQESRKKGHELLARELGLSQGNKLTRETEGIQKWKKESLN